MRRNTDKRKRGEKNEYCLIAMLLDDSPEFIIHGYRWINLEFLTQINHARTTPQIVPGLSGVLTQTGRG